MQKMLIQLDEERIKREGKYSIEKMWSIIDEAFSYGQCIKEVQSDGSVMYSGNPNRDNYLCDFGIAYVVLMDKIWFADFASKWIWYNNDDDENLPFQDSDCLVRAKKEFGLI